MDVQVDKKVAPMIISHWTNKFDKAIRILLQNGIKADVLMEKIKVAENEKNS